MKNRIKELRDARKMSLEELATAIGDSTTASTIHKLETGAMKLTTEWIEKIGRGLGIDPIEVIDDRIQPAGFAENVTRYTPQDAPAAVASRQMRPHHARYVVSSNALDELGIMRGDVVECDERPETIAAVATGDIVIANIDDGVHASTVMRMFVEPAMLITNSRTDNATPINIRTMRATIVGVVVESYRQLTRRR